MNYSIVILSKNPANCAGCVRRIYQMEPDLRRSNIIVVDDGARKDAEPKCPGVTWLDGEKPFGYARNANIGLRHAFQESEYAILLNDDALLTSRGGFTGLVSKLASAPSFGLLSAACNNVGNHNQQYKAWGETIRPECRMLCFVCVAIPRRVWEVVGELDEEFSDGYGFEDDDYSRRVRDAGWHLGVWDGCRIDHGTLKSSYRSGAYPREGFERNKRLFQQKYELT